MTRKDYQLIADAIGLALATERKEREALVLNSSYYGPGVTFIEFFDAANR
jgi:hypothetical protein